MYIYVKEEDEMEKTRKKNGTYSKLKFDIHYLVSNLWVEKF